MSKAATLPAAGAGANCPISAPAPNLSACRSVRPRVTYRTDRIAGEEQVYLELGRQICTPGGTTRIADRAGVSVPMISRVAHGDSPVTPRIAAALGFRLRYERSVPRDASPVIRPCPVCAEDRHLPCPFDSCPWRPPVDAMEVEHG